jgi:hypothetical protein
MNWKNYVEKKNAKTFVIPPGWDSRETIAEQLECSPEKVDDHLRPSLRSGEVVKDIFNVWDSALKRLVRVIAYREADKASPASPKADGSTIIALRKSGLGWPEIGAKLGISADSARMKHRRALAAQ